MSDLLESLRAALNKEAAGQSPHAAAALVNCLVQRCDLVAAIAEIERLRSLVGAVSPGPSLADIKTQQQSQCGAADEPA